MIFKRIKNLWELSRFKPSTDNGLEGYIAGVTLEEEIPVGDGKAEFIGEGTVAEYEEQEKRDEGVFGLFGTGKRKEEIITQDEI